MYEYCKRENGKSKSVSKETVQAKVKNQKQREKRELFN